MNDALKKAFHLVDKVAARPIGTVTSHPILLARLGLVLGVPHNVPPQLMLPMSKLAEVAVEAGALLLEVAANLGLEAGVGTLVRAACRVATPAQAVKTRCSLNKCGSKVASSRGQRQRQLKVLALQSSRRLK